MPGEADPRLVTLAERLQGLAVGRGLTVATAESSTGGLVAAAITSIPGSSTYFLGGVVSYSDAAKTDLLGVSTATLGAHGAVSAQTAMAMAHGARTRFGASLAVAITGVAGPAGGSEAKPVGLTYIGLAAGGAAEVRRFAWTGDRTANRLAAAEAALAWLVERAESAMTIETAAPDKAGGRSSADGADRREPARPR